MDKDDKKYITVNVDGVDYELEVDDQTYTDDICYKIKIGRTNHLLFGGDPEELLKSVLESKKRREEFKRSESENKFVIKDVKNLKLSNFTIIDENGNEKVINKEFKDVKELTLDDLLNLSDN